MVMRTPLLVALCLAAFGCSGGGNDAPGADAGSDARFADVSADLGSREVIFKDRKAADVEKEVLLDIWADLDPDPPVLACDPGEGCFLDHCEENGDCQSSWCVEHLGEGVCTQTCQEECPPGWKCKQVGGTDPDVIFICVSDHANLCKPCDESDDCESAGGAQDVCVDYGLEGFFCGGGCVADEDCPWGFSCLTAVTVDDIDTMQCVADAGVCPCTDKSVALSLWTPCEGDNDWGTCSGKRVCTSEGLSDCDAAVPAEEVCNGFDDDCDEETDEPPLIEGEYGNLCDDGNACTEDKCKGEEGCVSVPTDGAECMDGDPCTMADHCVQDVCVGTPVECKDDDPCTDEGCDENGGCVFAANSAACDDGDPCTVGDQCDATICAGTELACECLTDEDCLELEDGDVCNGSLVCDTSALPYQCAVDGDTLIECAPPEDGPAAACLKAHCVPATGDCEVVPANDNFGCDDGNACTAGDKCDQGFCTAGIEINCADDNPCTDDFCDVAAGCTHEANGAPCSDGSVCTVNDSCTDGECAAGEESDCNDNNLCTADSCDPAGGCLHEPTEGNCDDGNACTTDDACDAGKCMAGGQLECDDDNICTDNSCDLTAGCVSTLNSVPCDDGDICSLSDHCHLGECIGSSTLVCNDGNVCTDDFCDDAVGCKFVPNGGLCDDGNPCTEGDICVGTICTAGDFSGCNDGNKCTIDSCDAVAGCLHLLIDPCCGNGLVEPPEECDDANGANDDDCLVTCVLATCDDGLKNSSESDVDCGGNCAPCPAGEECGDGDDCESKVCMDGLCQMATCDDKVANGTESDVDCGGNCLPCQLGQECEEDADCAGAAQCAPDDKCACLLGYAGSECDGCADGYQDNDENGTCLPDCATAGLACNGHGDCLDDGGTALCECHEGWDGANCDKCAEGYSYDFSSGNCIIATEVCGILQGNEVWTTEKSPYLVTCTLQIPANLGITIEPGVTVIGTGSSMFHVHGTVIAHGSPGQEIHIMGPTSKFFDMDGSNSNSHVDLRYVVVEKGSNLYFGGSGHLTLLDSRVTDVGGYSYVHYPAKDVHIERNVFVNSGGFSVGLSSNVKSYVRNNLFKGAATNGVWVRSWAAYSTSIAVVQYNSFVDVPPQSRILELEKGHDSAKMTAKENYWGTEDTGQIDKWIYDKNDDITSAGNIDYLPLLAQPHADTPTE